MLKQREEEKIKSQLIEMTKEKKIEFDRQVIRIYDKTLIIE